MKPRLESAPRTAEDRYIWLRLLHGKWPPLPFRGYMDADRRDADLMFYAQEERGAHHVVRNLDPYAINSVVWVRPVRGAGMILVRP
jgi:hypothetical protein